MQVSALSCTKSEAEYRKPWKSLTSYLPKFALVMLSFSLELVHLEMLEQRRAASAPRLRS